MKLTDEIKHCVESMMYMGNYQSVTFNCVDEEILFDLIDVVQDNYSSEVLIKDKGTVKFNLPSVTDVSVEYTVLLVDNEQHLHVKYKESDCTCSECGDLTVDYIKVFGEMAYPTYEGHVGKLTHGAVLCIKCLEHQHISMDNKFNIEMYNKCKESVSNGKRLLVKDEYIFIDTETIYDSVYKPYKKGGAYLNPNSVLMYPSLSSEEFIRCANNCVIVNGYLEYTKNGKNSVVLEKEGNILSHIDYGVLLGKIKEVT